MIVSGNSGLDHRHIIRYEGMTSHGHVVIPLRAVDRIVGVLCLYIQPDHDLDIRVLHLLFSLGNQIGIAIGNAKLYEETRNSSLHNPLTGLGNRRLPDVMLPKCLALASRFRQDLCVIMLDIDHFKRYDDTHGHVAGDKLLAKAGGMISRKTRECDIAVRCGGEEFLIVVPGTDLKGACDLAENLRKSHETEIGITASLGVAQNADGPGKEVDLVARADAALYRAKKDGRNRVEAEAGGAGQDNGSKEGEDEGRKKD